MKNFKKHLAIMLASSLCFSCITEYQNVTADAEIISTQAEENTTQTEITGEEITTQPKETGGEEITTLPEETSGEEITTLPEETSSEEITTQPEETTTAPVRTKISLEGTYTRRGIYAKKKVNGYDCYLNKIMVLKKGIRYYESKRLNNGYSKLSVNGTAVYVETKYLTSKCNAKKFVSTTDTKYSYKDMVKDIKQLQKAYASILSTEIVGKSADKRDLYTIVLGNKNAKKTIFIDSTIHAREWKNSQVIMKLTENICRKYDSGTYKGKAYSKLFKKVRLVIMPMMNPDGVTISQYGPGKIKSKKLRKKIISVANGNYSTWKANARCIDLNRNFAEGFTYHSRKGPSRMDYPGTSPLSEPETKAIVSVVEKYNPVAALNFHEAGQVIYYKNSSSLLSLVQQQTNYQLIREGGAAYGSFSDYLNARGITNCTLENGIVPAPLGHWQFKSIYKKNKYLLLAAAKLYYK